MYTTKKVMDIIKNYSNYQKALDEYRKEYRSIGVTVYSEEAAMPKANNISDPTANEAIKHTEKVTALSNIYTDLKYVQQRIDRVPNKLMETLDLRLAGCSVREIYNITNKSQSLIYKELKEIAQYICREI